MTTILAFKCDVCGDPLETSRTRVELVQLQNHQNRVELAPGVDACGGCAPKAIVTAAALLAKFCDRPDDPAEGVYFRATLIVERVSGKQWQDVQETAQRAARSYG